MNNRDIKDIYAVDRDDMAQFERRMQKRLSRGMRRERNRKILRLVLVVFLLVMVIAAAALLVFGVCSQSSSPLKGTWAYGEGAVLRFGGMGRGAIILEGSESPFTYKAEGDTLRLCFENAYIGDAVYTFAVEEERLTLIGGEGTAGGRFTLTKENP